MHHVMRANLVTRRKILLLMMILKSVIINTPKHTAITKSYTGRHGEEVFGEGLGSKTNKTEISRTGSFTGGIPASVEWIRRG